jgi:hypothetical protein
MIIHVVSSPLPSKKDTFNHDYDTSVDKSPIPKSLQKTSTSNGQGANYAWKAYAPGAYSSHFSPVRGIQKSTGYSPYPLDGARQEGDVPEAALALSDLDDYSRINKSARSESPLLQQTVSPFRNSTMNGRSPIALSSPIYSFGRAAQPLNASQSSRLTFPVKPRQSAFSKIPFSRMSSPVETDAKEDIKSLGTSVQSRQGTPVAEALVTESTLSPLARDVGELKVQHEDLKRDVQDLKERDGAYQQVCTFTWYTKEFNSHTHFDSLGTGTPSRTISTVGTNRKSRTNREIGAHCVLCETFPSASNKNADNAWDRSRLWPQDVFGQEDS